MRKFTDNYGNEVDINPAGIRSIRSYTYGSARTTVTRIEFDGGDTQNVRESVEGVKDILKEHSLSFMWLHDVYGNEVGIVRSKIKTTKNTTYGLSHTTLTTLEYHDGGTINITEDLESVRRQLQS